MRLLRGWWLVVVLGCGSPASEPPSAPPPVPSPPSPVPTAPAAPVVEPTSIVPAAPRVRLEGFDVRATFWDQPIFVLGRGPARAASGDGEPLGDDSEMDTLVRWPLGPASGEAVRIVFSDHVCDGTLGRRWRIEAPWLDTESEGRARTAHDVVGCEGQPILAIVSPTPGAPWPEAIAAGDAAAAPALDAARAAATSLVRGSSAATFDATAYRLDGSIYGVASGPRCDDDEEMGCVAAGTAVVRVDAAGTATTLIVRPVHFPWEEPTGAGYGPCGLFDVDGDGQVELCEQMVSDQGRMIRLVRPGDGRAGEMVWRMEEVAEYTLPEAGAAPAPVPHGP